IKSRGANIKPRRARAALTPWLPATALILRLPSTANESIFVTLQTRCRDSTRLLPAKVPQAYRRHLSTRSSILPEVLGVLGVTPKRRGGDTKGPVVATKEGFQ